MFCVWIVASQDVVGGARRRLVTRRHTVWSVRPWRVALDTRTRVEDQVPGDAVRVFRPNAKISPPLRHSRPELSSSGRPGRSGGRAVRRVRAPALRFTFRVERRQNQHGRQQQAAQSVDSGRSEQHVRSSRTHTQSREQQLQQSRAAEHQSTTSKPAPAAPEAPARATKQQRQSRQRRAAQSGSRAAAE